MNNILSVSPRWPCDIRCAAHGAEGEVPILSGPALGTESPAVAGPVRSGVPLNRIPLASDVGRPRKSYVPPDETISDAQYHRHHCQGVFKVLSSLLAAAECCSSAKRLSPRCDAVFVPCPDPKRAASAARGCFGQPAIVGVTGVSEGAWPVRPAMRLTDCCRVANL